MATYVFDEPAMYALLDDITSAERAMKAAAESFQTSLSILQGNEAAGGGLSIAGGTIESVAKKNYGALETFWSQFKTMQGKLVTVGEILGGTSTSAQGNANGSIGDLLRRLGGFVTHPQPNFPTAGDVLDGYDGTDFFVDGLGEIIGTFYPNIGNTVDAVKAAGQGTADNILDYYYQYDDGKITMAEYIGGAGGSALTGIVTGTVDGVLNYIGLDIPDNLVQAVNDLGGTIGKGVGSLVDTGIEVGGNVIKAVGKLFGSFWRC